MWAVVAGLLFGFMPNAAADEIVIPGFATISYPNQVKLKKTGCQELPFKYVIDENLAMENTVFAVAISPMNTKKAFGAALWFSRQTYMGESALPSMARIGVLQVKVCRKPFVFNSKTTKKMPAINPGVHRMIIDASYTDPKTGALIGDTIELIKTIRFY